MILIQRMLNDHFVLPNLNLDVLGLGGAAAKHEQAGGEPTLKKEL